MSTSPVIPPRWQVGVPSADAGTVYLGRVYKSYTIPVLAITNNSAIDPEDPAYADIATNRWPTRRCHLDLSIDGGSNWIRRIGYGVQFGPDRIYTECVWSPPEDYSLMTTNACIRAIPLDEGAWPQRTPAMPYDIQPGQYPASGPFSIVGAVLDTPAAGTILWQGMQTTINWRQMGGGAVYSLYWLTPTSAGIDVQHWLTTISNVTHGANSKVISLNVPVAPPGAPGCSEPLRPRPDRLQSNLHGGSMTETPIKHCPCCGRIMEGFAFKNFDYDEVLSKCGKIHSIGDMVINFTELSFTKAGVRAKLRKNEWKYLAILISESGNPVSRDTLYRIVVGLDGGTTRTVDTFIANMRHHFGRHIETVHGLGYRWVDVPGELYKKAKPVKIKTPPKVKIPRPEKVKIEKVYLHKLNETVMIPTRKITRVVMDIPPLPESSERLYRIQGTHVQWNGQGTPPELISAYERSHGELPPFIALPNGHIRFNLGDHSVTWSGVGPLPYEVLHHLDEFATLPPWTRRESKGKKAA